MTPTPDTGVWAAGRRLVAGVLALAEKRLELFTIELQEEKLRLFNLLWRAVAAVVLGFLALITATALLVVCLWETAPVLTLLVVTLAYGLTAAGLAWSIVRQLRQGPRPFAATVAEFRKDCAWLGKPD